MHSFQRFVRFIGLIIREGNFVHSGHSFETVRREMLKDLGDLTPVRTPQPPSQWQRWILKYPRLRSFYAQAAFLKDSLRRRGGHLCVPALNLCYVRNPRAASTALASAMLQARFPELIRQVLTPVQINFLTDVHLHYHVRPEQGNATLFTVIRDPFARIVSVYRAFFEHADEPFIYEDYLFGILRKELSFKGFAKRIRLIPDFLMDQHLKPQHVLLEYYRHRNMAVSVFRLEEPEKLSGFLSAYSIEVKAFNMSESPYDYREYFDEESLEWIYRIYEKDISRFGYEARYEELKKWVCRQEFKV